MSKRLRDGVMCVRLKIHTHKVNDDSLKSRVMVTWSWLWLGLLVE